MPANESVAGASNWHKKDLLLINWARIQSAPLFCAKFAVSGGFASSPPTQRLIANEKQGGIGSGQGARQVGFVYDWKPEAQQ